MSGDSYLKEDESPLVTGPINKMRWIYSCSKQMMDRLIFAYGQEEGLRFTLFRPFNWVGPRLDTFRDAEENKARSVTQMIYNVLHRKDILGQRRQTKKELHLGRRRDRGTGLNNRKQG